MEYGDNSETDRETVLLARARDGDAYSREQLLSLHRERLTAMVHLRMSPQLARRVDAADVVQEAMIEAATRLDQYLADSLMDFYVWLRWLVRDKLVDLHRQHLGAAKRDANREFFLESEAGAASSLALADFLVGDLTSPSRAAVREEIQRVIREGLANLSDQDREILMLRHFEQLSIDQAAQCLQISKSGANKRHLKALRQLKTLVAPFMDTA